MTRILVAGVMRSGKTLLATELGRLARAELVEEPDNPLSRPFAFRVKRRLGRRYFPGLRPGDVAPEYERLWREAFALVARTGTVRPFDGVRGRVAQRLLSSASPDDVLLAVSGTGATPTRRLRMVEALAVPERPEREAASVVVTANAPLCVEWVAEHVAPAVVVVVREPIGVLASWAQLDWLGRPGHDMLDELDPQIAGAAAERLGVPIPPGGSPPLERAAWLLGLLLSHLREGVSRNPSWLVVSYDRLVARPLEQLRELARHLDLPWDDAFRTRLAPRGIGRFASEPSAARSDVDARSLERAGAVLEAFPLGEWRAVTAIGRGGGCSP